MAQSSKARRVLVIGASSGIGRAIAQDFAREGARVVFSARRAERLREAIDAIGSGVAIPGDVRRPQDCERIVAGAVEALGGLDLLVYSTGFAPLRLLADQDADAWREVFETNATGAFLVARAALPHLDEHAIFAYLSSISVKVPYYGLGAYRASKAALDVGMEAFQMERPDLRFTRFTVGDTTGTEAASANDPELTARLIGEFQRHGNIRERYLEVNTVARLIAQILRAGLEAPGTWIGDVEIRPMGPPISSSIDAAAALSRVEEFKA